MYQEGEIVKNETGGNYFNDQMSRLCKAKLSQRFRQLVQSDRVIRSSSEEPETISLLPLDVDLNTATYRELKLSSTQYMGAKFALFKSFADSGFGTWVQAPCEIDQFTMNSESNADPPENNPKTSPV